jgi:hypothetical protein
VGKGKAGVEMDGGREGTGDRERERETMDGWMDEDEVGTYDGGG